MYSMDGTDNGKSPRAGEHVWLHTNWCMYARFFAKWLWWHICGHELVLHYNNRPFLPSTLNIGQSVPTVDTRCQIQMNVIWICTSIQIYIHDYI